MRYTLAPGVGVYQPTEPTPPPPAPFPQFGNWGNVTPFALGNAAQFGPGQTDFLMNSTCFSAALDVHRVTSKSGGLNAHRPRPAHA